VSANYRRVWLAFGGLWVSVVLWLSLTPHPPQPLTFESSDKLEHCLAYAFLMSWFAVVLHAGSRQVSVIGLIVMGVLVEILQGWSGYRYFEYADMVANSSGVFAAWLMMHVWGDGLVVKFFEVRVE
jgi:VanZ family protein